MPDLNLQFGIALGASGQAGGIGTPGHMLMVSRRAIGSTLEIGSISEAPRCSLIKAIMA